jgi:hypothetical protein
VIYCETNEKEIHWITAQKEKGENTSFSENMNKKKRVSKQNYSERKQK